MLSKDYNKASCGLSGCLLSDEWEILQQVFLGGKWIYRKVRGKKCRACKNIRPGLTKCAPRIGRTCNCGNPFIYALRRHHKIPGYTQSICAQ